MHILLTIGSVLVLTANRLATFHFSHSMIYNPPPTPPASILIPTTCLLAGLRVADFDCLTSGSTLSYMPTQATLTHCKRLNRFVLLPVYATNQW